MFCQGKRKCLGVRVREAEDALEERGARLEECGHAGDGDRNVQHEFPLCRLDLEDGERKAEREERKREQRELERLALGGEEAEHVAEPPAGGDLWRVPAEPAVCAGQRRWRMEMMSLSSCIAAVVIQRLGRRAELGMEAVWGGSDELAPQLSSN